MHRHQKESLTRAGAPVVVEGTVGSAILITYDKEDLTSEAVGLCDAAGYRVVHTVRQRFLKRPRYGISEEALEALKGHADRLDPDMIIYDEILNPSQNYNLASALRRKILDRESLILEIFEGRSSSAESKLQVKLARLRYEMARAKEWVRLSSMGEQPGFMGIGKFGVDVYYNDIKHRMQTTKSKLEKSGRQRRLHRRGRKKSGFRTVSLAGYTSAGKTALFNAMTGAEREQGCGLFTTLSTLTRRLTVGREAFLISDTIGFISKLPAYMIDAFRSTLEELAYADVVLVAVDVSDPLPVLRKKLSSCARTLDELGVSRDRIAYVLNKSDLLADERDADSRVGELDPAGSGGGVRWVLVSAKTGRNMRQLKDLIGSMASAARGDGSGPGGTGPGGPGGGPPESRQEDARDDRGA